MLVLTTLLSALSDAALLAAAGGFTYTATVFVATLASLIARTSDRRRDARATLALLTRPVIHRRK
ncbi:hypothetical protein GCM10027589_12900 [Actinocorallia lasiicapitis]